MTTEIIKRFTNEEDGIEAVVAEIDKGYSVALRDIDADTYVGLCIIYPTAKEAIEKAKTII